MLRLGLNLLYVAVTVISVLCTTVKKLQFRRLWSTKAPTAPTQTAPIIEGAQTVISSPAKQQFGRSGSKSTKAPKQPKEPVRPSTAIENAQAGPFIGLPEILQRIAGFCSPNDVAYSLRRLNKATAAQFHQYTTLKLSQSSAEDLFERRWGSASALRSCSLKQRRQLLCLTSASGNINNLKVVMKALYEYMVGEGPTSSSSAPSSCTWRWLQDHGCFWIKELVPAAAAAGHQAMCEWLMADGCPFDAEAVYSAMRSGHLRLVDWMFQERPWLRTHVDPARLVVAAAEGCALSVLQQLCKEWLPTAVHGGLDSTAGPSTSSSSSSVSLFQCQQPQQPFLHAYWRGHILAAAAASSTPDWRSKVEWLEDLGCPRTSPLPCARVAGTVPTPFFSFTAAANSSSVDRLTWLRRRGYPADADALDAAAGSGNMPALRYLITEAGLRPSNCIPAVTAAKNGQLAALQTLHEARCPFDVRYTLCDAARGGHMPVVEWLVSTVQGTACESLLGVQAAFAAAQSGNLELVKWLAARGCELPPDIVGAAAYAGSEEMVEWLVKEKDCELEYCGRPYTEASSNGDVAILRCLHRLGCPMNASDQPYEAAARTGGVATLRVLGSLGFPSTFTRATLEQWVRSGYPLAVLRWLVDEGGSPGPDWGSAVRSAEHRQQQQQQAGGGAGGVGGGYERDILDWLRMRTYVAAPTRRLPEGDEHMRMLLMMERYARRRMMAIDVDE